MTQLNNHLLTFLGICVQDYQQEQAQNQQMPQGYFGKPNPKLGKLNLQLDWFVKLKLEPFELNRLNQHLLTTCQQWFACLDRRTLSVLAQAASYPQLVQLIFCLLAKSYLADYLLPAESLWFNWKETKHALAVRKATTKANYQRWMQGKEVTSFCWNQDYNKSKGGVLWFEGDDILADAYRLRSLAYLSAPYRAENAYTVFPVYDAPPQLEFSDEFFASVIDDAQVVSNYIESVLDPAAQAAQTTESAPSDEDFIESIRSQLAQGWAQVAAQAQEQVQGQNQGQAQGQTHRQVQAPPPTQQTSSRSKSTYANQLGKSIRERWEDFVLANFALCQRRESSMPQFRIEPIKRFWQPLEKTQEYRDVQLARFYQYDDYDLSKLAALQQAFTAHTSTPTRLTGFKTKTAAASSLTSPDEASLAANIAKANPAPEDAAGAPLATSDAGLAMSDLLGHTLSYSRGKAQPVVYSYPAPEQALELAIPSYGFKGRPLSYAELLKLDIACFDPANAEFWFAGENNVVINGDLVINAMVDTIDTRAYPQAWEHGHVFFSTNQHYLDVMHPHWLELLAIIMLTEEKYGYQRYSVQSRAQHEHMFAKVQYEALSCYHACQEQRLRAWIAAQVKLGKITPIDTNPSPTQQQITSQAYSLILAYLKQSLAQNTLQLGTTDLVKLGQGAAARIWRTSDFLPQVDALTKVDAEVW